ncbi:hypothetical protein DCC81_25090 [Chitinophaga parva]|uniref:Uncharacterized protein n=1 Tax=Chitinophaga parva TaxID=2169414 RepID=A0A2T7BBU1_9BACT|nr:hypothetical protein [Chitinophaga parva]PUZ21864.1 hypothetical protein DCC81_25090 [Chitinophaga parva]
MGYNNWSLQENEDFIKPAFENYEQYAYYMKSKHVEFNFDLGSSDSFIDWRQYPDSYSFWYYFIGCEEEVAAYFRRTELIKYDTIIMDFGKRDPICEISMNVFIDKWLDFVAGAHYETTAVTGDGKLFMEFKKGDILFSNFKIK